MVMLVFSVGARLLLGWRVGLALAVGVCLQVSRLRRENAGLVNLLNGVASDLERAVEDVDSCLEGNSQTAGK